PSATPNCAARVEGFGLEPGSPQSRILPAIPTPGEYPMNQNVSANEQAVTQIQQPETEQARLVSAARSADTSAGEALVMRNKRLVLAVTRRVTGNLMDAEDVSQEAFMKAFA